jgi:5-methylcytosine-specific restriction endonuclease McrA
MTLTQLRRIFDKTRGHCHFCGDLLLFHRRGWREKNLPGFWEVDHVIQRRKGGASAAENYLPACTRCNRLRWHRKGEMMRRLLRLGLIAHAEIRRATKLGKELAHREAQQLSRNRLRRRKS